MVAFQKQRSRHAAVGAPLKSISSFASNWTMCSLCSFIIVMWIRVRTRSGSMRGFDGGFSANFRCLSGVSSREFFLESLSRKSKISWEFFILIIQDQLSYWMLKFLLICNFKRFVNGLGFICGWESAAEIITALVLCVKFKKLKRR